MKSFCGVLFLEGHQTSLSIGQIYDLLLPEEVSCRNYYDKRYLLREPVLTVLYSMDAKRIVNEMVGDPGDIARFVKSALPDIHMDSLTTVENHEATGVWLVRVKGVPGESGWLGGIDWYKVEDEGNRYYLDPKQFVDIYITSPDWEWKSGAKWVKMAHRNDRVFYPSLVQVKRALFKEPMVQRRIARLSGITQSAVESIADKSSARDRRLERVVAMLETDEWKVARSGYHTNGRAYVIGTGVCQSVHDVVESVDTSADCAHLFVENIQPDRKSSTAPWQVDFTILQDADEDSEDLSAEELSSMVLDTYPGVLTRKFLRGIHLLLKTKLPSLSSTSGHSNGFEEAPRKLFISFGISDRYPIFEPKTEANFVSSVSCLAAVREVISELGIQPYGDTPDAKISIKVLHPATKDGWFVQFAADGPEDYHKMSTDVHPHWAIDESADVSMFKGVIRKGTEDTPGFRDTQRLYAIKAALEEAGFVVHRAWQKPGSFYVPTQARQIDVSVIFSWAEPMADYKIETKVIDAFYDKDINFRSSLYFTTIFDRPNTGLVSFYCSSYDEPDKRRALHLDFTPEVDPKVDESKIPDSFMTAYASKPKALVKEGHEDAMRATAAVATPLADDRLNLTKLSHALHALGCPGGQVKFKTTQFSESEYMVGVSGTILPSKEWKNFIPYARPPIQHAIRDAFPKDPWTEIGVHSSSNEDGIIFACRAVRPLKPGINHKTMLLAKVGQDAEYAVKYVRESMDPAELVQRAIPDIRFHGIMQNIADELKRSGCKGKVVLSTAGYDAPGKGEPYKQNIEITAALTSVPGDWYVGRNYKDFFADIVHAEFLKHPDLPKHKAIAYGSIGDKVNIFVAYAITGLFTYHHPKVYMIEGMTPGELYRRSIIGSKLDMMGKMHAVAHKLHDMGYIGIVHTRISKAGTKRNAAVFRLYKHQQAMFHDEMKKDVAKVWQDVWGEDIPLADMLYQFMEPVDWLPRHTAITVYSDLNGYRMDRYASYGFVYEGMTPGELYHRSVKGTRFEAVAKLIEIANHLARHGLKGELAIEAMFTGRHHMVAKLTNIGPETVLQDIEDIFKVVFAAQGYPLQGGVRVLPRANNEVYVHSDVARFVGAEDNDVVVIIEGIAEGMDPKELYKKSLQGTKAGAMIMLSNLVNSL